MNAQQLKNSILQEAIEGRLVPQDSNDEPASVLLDKIRKEKARLVKEGKLKKKDLEEKPISEDEKPFEIPEGWMWVRLGEISTYANTKRKINAAQADSNIWGLDLEDIEKGGKLLCIKSVGERKAIGDKTSFSKGDILYSKLRPYLLKILIAPKDGICTPEIIPFTCYGNICKDYIVWLLKSAYVDDYINSVTFGVKMPRVSTETMVSLIIPLPPLAEQKRIVAKIEELLPKVEAYGKAQEKLNKLNEELPEKLKKSILQEAIEGRLVPQDPNDEPASVLLDKIRKEKARLVKEGKLKKKDLEETPISEDEIPFKIPESWEWVKLGNVSEIARGGSPRPIKEYLTEDINGLNWIKIGDTDKGGKYINSCKEKIKPEGLKKTRMVHPGDFLLTNSMSFGRPYITNIEGCIHDGWLMISPYANAFDQSYLYHVLSSAFAHKQFSEKVAGAVVQNLNSDKVADSLVPLPPLAEQKRIVAKVEQLLHEIDKLKV